METPIQPIKNWQGWLAKFRDIYSTQGFMEFIDIANDDDDDVDENEGWNWMATFMIPVQTSLCSTLLMACLQTQPDQVEKTLASIIKVVTGIRFDKAPRGLKRAQKDLYQNIMREMTRIVPPMAEMIATIIKCYAHDDYDMMADVNMQMREAISLLSSRNRAGALQAMSQAGASVLRGAHVWDGWTSEGSGEFEIWALSIITIRNALIRVLPLQNYAEQRQRVDDVAAKLFSYITEIEQTDDESESAPDEREKPVDDEMATILGDIGKIILRDEPFTDDEIREMGDRYKAYGELAIRSISTLLGVVEDNDEAANILRVFVILLGILRYPERIATLQLTMMVTTTSERVDDETTEEAFTALKRIGPPALPEVFDFVRYSSREDERVDMLQVLGVVGRGSDEVYDYLVKEFTEASWLDDKIDYVLPLALTHDPRATGYIYEALHEPSLDDDDAWELLDALQELDVTFYINHDNRSVNIPGYGVIEDVLPSDWRSRKEIEEEEDEEWDEDEEHADDFNLEGDDEEDDDDDDESDNEVVYDKDGTPRCPGCGAEMHYIDGVWVHEQDVDKPKSPKPQIKAVGRNDPCPCGSGKKYKYCHGRDLNE